MKKLRHSKYKNTGFLFELLTRQITVDIINGKNSIAENILSKYFKKNTELNKELKLYHYLLKQEVKHEQKASRVIDTAVDLRKRLSEYKLKKEKYELVKEIKDNYNIEDFFRSKLPNYKVLASIYKLFENASSKDLYQPIDVDRSKNTLIESLIIRPKQKVLSNPIIESFSIQDQDIRLLAYKRLVETFNNKYKTLSEDQKRLLKEYINNIANTNSLREYVNTEIETIRKKLKSYIKKIDDKVTVIKLEETIKQLSHVTEGTTVRDNQVTSIMIAYELIKELENVTTK